MQKSLVAFDTDHIKEYVFGTDRLKEISGASSLLDRLNRQEMIEIAAEYDIKDKKAIIYTNGGSGLFVVDRDKAKDFGKHVQRKYKEMTGGGASITFVEQPLPDNAPEDLDKLLDHDLSHDHTLELMRYKLREKKASPVEALALSSHPFMRPCDACGIFYAEEEDNEEGGLDNFYCASCWKKRREDDDFGLDFKKRNKRKSSRSAKTFLWDRILNYLDKVEYIYDRRKVERPNDFNEFRQLTKGKDYLGLIYADANNMGTKIEQLSTLRDIQTFADHVDDVIYRAMSLAIKQHLPVANIADEDEAVPTFPFDVLLVGGDDIVIVTDATKAMNVALAIAQKFHDLANDKEKFANNKQILELLENSRMSLSVGVVLAPVKYPFGLLQDMAESALKFAKQAAADDRAKAADQKQFDGSRINFLVVTGGSKPDFKLIYNDIYRRTDKDKSLEFHASLRPYKPEDLERLLGSIREGRKLRLGRTKLHQLREAVLDKNLTTSVQKGLATWHNWRSEKQRGYVTSLVYEYAARRQAARANVNDPASLFPRVTFPWFADGKNKERDVYRTSLLDFIELYDFIAREGEDNGDEA